MTLELADLDRDPILDACNAAEERRQLHGRT